MSLALEALQKERQRGGRDFSMLTVNAIEAIESVFRDHINDTQTARLYFECHITLDPVPERERNGTDILLRQFGFKLAKLFMEKGVPSTHDTFATAHDTDLDTLKECCANAISCLRKHGYTVRRYKIEDTILDSRHDGDVLSVFVAPEGYELVRKAN